MAPPPQQPCAVPGCDYVTPENIPTWELVIKQQDFSRLFKNQIQDMNKIKSSHVSKEKTNLMQEAPGFSLLRRRNCTMLFRNGRFPA